MGKWKLTFFLSQWGILKEFLKINVYLAVLYVPYDLAIDYWLPGRQNGYIFVLCRSVRTMASMANYTCNRRIMGKWKLTFFLSQWGILK